MTAPEAVIGIDIGTGGIRAVALELESGNFLAKSQSRLQTSRSNEGARTQELDDWIVGVSVASQDLMAKLGRGSRVARIALTSAAHNACVQIKGNDEPLPIVLWSDARSQSALKALPTRLRQRVRQQTRVALDTTWTFTQFRWLSDVHADRWVPTDVQLGHGAVVEWLTGVKATDPSTASGTGFFDPVGHQWCDDLLQEIGLSAAVLPPVVDSQTVVGFVSEEAGRITGLPEGTPVICGGTDTACELLAAQMTEPGTVLIKAATSGTAVTVVESPVDNQRALIYPHVVKERWYLVSPTNSAWSSVTWLAGILGEDVVDLALKSCPGASGLSFLPHLDGERVPLWSRDAEGGFVGLRPNHQREDLARAAIEGVCFSLADALDYLEEVAGDTFSSVRLSGGGLQRRGVAKILSSAINRPALLDNRAEPSRGAAELARISLGREPESGHEVQLDSVEPTEDLALFRLEYRRRQAGVNGPVLSRNTSELN